MKKLLITTIFFSFVGRIDAIAQHDTFHLLTSDTFNVEKNEYIIQAVSNLTGTGSRIYVVKEKVDTIIRFDYLPADFQLVDFNNDSFADIMFVRLPTNVPNICDLFLYQPSQQTYRKVEGFDAFPDPRRIIGSNCFYSYQRTGCADMNWESSLFLIDANTLNKLGVMEATLCPISLDSLSQESIRVFEFNQSGKCLYEEIHMDELVKYKDKWGFIEEYWEHNWSFIID